MTPDASLGPSLSLRVHAEPSRADWERIYALREGLVLHDRLRVARFDRDLTWVLPRGMLPTVAALYDVPVALYGVPVTPAAVPEPLLAHRVRLLGRDGEPMTGG